MKSLSKLFFYLYILLLIWLILFKSDIRFLAILTETGQRSVNAMPFAQSGGRMEILLNFLVFMPFGLLLPVNFKRFSLSRNVLIILLFSLSMEIIQFVLAIGTSDVTDLITNTSGGIVGLIVYKIGSAHLPEEKFDGFLTILGIIFACILLSIRFFVFRVRF